MKNAALIIFTFLICLSMVYAVPPQESTGGLNIIYPKEDAFIYGSNTDLHYHVYDGNNFLVTNETTECQIHIYDNYGNHIVEDNLSFDSNGIDFYYDFTTTQNTEAGQRTIIVWCNNSIDAGYVSYATEWNSSGHIVDLGKYLTIILMMAIIVCILILVSYKLNLFYFDQIPVLQHLSLVIIMWLCVPIINIGIKINELQFLGLTNTLNGVYKAFIYIMIFISSMWLIGFLYQVYQHYESLGSKKKGDFK